MLKVQKFISIFLFLNFYFFTTVEANCSNLLRLQIKTNLGFELFHLVGETSKKYYQDREEVFDIAFSDQTLKSIIHKKTTKEYAILSKALLSKKIYLPFLKILKIVHDSLNDPIFIREWGRNLHLDLITEIYSEGTLYDREQLHLHNRISEEIALNVLTQRSRKGGFDGDIEESYTALTTAEFSAILKDKKLILDKGFEQDLHGSLIHILHVDMIIYALKKHQIQPNLASEFYRWMGESHKIELENRQVFDSLKHGWAALFDTTEFDITSPEILNPILKVYFRWVF